MKKGVNTKVKNNLSEFFQDDNGYFSATRLIFVIWTLGTLFVWIKIGWKSSALPVIPDSILYIIGILMGGKVFQKFKEVEQIEQTNSQEITNEEK